jgi:hypothetical protein
MMHLLGWTHSGDFPSGLGVRHPHGSNPAWPNALKNHPDGKMITR